MAIDQEKYLAAKQKMVERAHGGRPLEDRSGERLPPGQHLVTNFPVLDLGIQPYVQPEAWTCELKGACAHPGTLTWNELMALPQADIVRDFHCVTTWSKFDVPWRGVRFSDVAAAAGVLDTCRAVMFHGRDGYTTNVLMEELMRDDDILLAHSLEGQPLPKEHGGPVRIVVHHLYAWKGAKFLNGIDFLTADRRGFWEVRGYHNHADPWKNERYSSQEY